MSDIDSTSLYFNIFWDSIKKHKKLYFWILPIAFFLALVYQCGKPDYYKCKVKLSPELDGDRRSASAKSIISMFITNTDVQKYGEMLMPVFYPELMNSADFKSKLLSVKIRRDKNEEELTYYDYLLNYQKKPWWKTLFRENKYFKEEPINSFKMTESQAALSDVIQAFVNCDVDKSNLVITISVVDQDPLVCALMADSVKSHLQDFLTDYLIRKALVELDYNKKLLSEARQKYKEAAKRYSEYTDTHRDANLQASLSKQSDLEEEMNQCYSHYSQIAKQYQKAEAKVQERKPAFTTLQSATVPLEIAGPNRSFNVIMFVSLLTVMITIYCYFKEGVWDEVITWMSYRKEELPFILARSKKMKSIRIEDGRH